MRIPAGKGFTIAIEQIKGSGYPRVVRLYKRGLFGRRLVSSDWFLNPDQARNFADQLAVDLRSSSGLANIRSRAPGWTLKRSSR
jgi:hypothetical protein